MTARQSSERVPNADRAFPGPSAESYPRKSRDRALVPNSCDRLLSYSSPQFGLSRATAFPSIILHSWPPASGSWAWGADLKCHRETLGGLKC